MSSSNATINDLKKDFQEKLQIDADLANATDVTAPWSFTTPVNNRTGNDDNIVDNWDKFYDHVDKSPPKAARDVDFKTAVEKANKLLSLSDFEEFKDKRIEHLTEDQQAIMMLMIIKKIDGTFGGAQSQVAKILVGALKPKTQGYNLFKAFVRRGGDRQAPITSMIVVRFRRTIEAFVTGFPFQTKLEDAITIFDSKKKKGMSPFLHIQPGSSYICVFNACSVLMYYYSYHVADQKATKANISKYIRDEIDGLKIANLTLTTEKGSSLKEILAGLMTSFGTADQGDLVESVNLDADDQDFNYIALRKYLQRGRPIALKIEGFPGSNDLQKKRYTGKLSDHYQDITKRPGPNDRSYHAVVCIGIKPRKGTNPPMLLLQDSSDRRPAFSMGLDLLMDMGIENLQFCTIPKSWKPNEGMRYKVTDKSRVFFAGSPMSIDKNNKPYILTRKEPVQEKRDMSEYLLPSGPGTCQVYFV